jgi:galactonate dehydratase
MPPDRLQSISLSTVEVTPRTAWTFLEIETEAGLRGCGEASLNGRGAAVAEAVAALAPAAFALADADPAALPRRRPADLPQAAAISAFDQALWDVTAQRRGMELAKALGTVRRDRVRVYANINRRTIERSPVAFAASARAAIAAGHEAIKLAPFDHVQPGVEPEALAPGLACVAAVREAIGPAVRLMIDCHWRLDTTTAEHVIAASEEFGVDWIECPLPETPAMAPAIARLRAAANRRGILLAGLENGVGIDGFAPFIEAASYDVMMPDIKYVGGLTETLRLADMLHAAGIALSPHNPSGPVCHAASLHLCAVATEVHSLEVQFDETPLFAELVGGDLHPACAGAIAVPTGRGLGVVLQDGPMQRHRLHHWRATRSGMHTHWGKA